MQQRMPWTSALLMTFDLLDHSISFSGWSWTIYFPDGYFLMRDVVNYDGFRSTLYVNTPFIVSIDNYFRSQYGSHFIDC